MALTDSFNAVYNKKEQAKQEKEELKTHDFLLENKLINDLQALQLDFITRNDKRLLILPKIKNKLIDEIIKTQFEPINKKSKYLNKNIQQAYLIKKYDTITTKTLKIAKNIEQIQKEKEAEAIQKQIETEAIKSLNITQKPQNRINWGNIQTIILYIIITPFALLWGILEGLAKGNKKKRR